MEILNPQGPQAIRAIGHEVHGFLEPWGDLDGDAVSGQFWSDHGLVFARDGYKIRPDGIKPGGPQDAGQVSARWRSTGQRLGLPDRFRIHDWRHSKATNDLEAGENPVEVSANVRHHSPGYTMAQYGKRRVEGARKPASGTAERIGLERLA